MKRRPQTCTICQSRIVYGDWIHSSHTGHYYCKNATACAKNAKKARQ